MFTMFMTKAKISPTTINKSSAEHINNVKSEKYKLTLNEIEKKSLENQRFRTEFNFERVKLSKKNLANSTGATEKFTPEKRKNYGKSSMLEKKH